MKKEIKDIIESLSTHIDEQKKILDEQTLDIIEEETIKKKGKIYNDGKLFRPKGLNRFKSFLRNFKSKVFRKKQPPNH